MLHYLDQSIAYGIVSYQYQLHFYNERNRSSVESGDQLGIRQLFYNVFYT